MLQNSFMLDIIVFSRFFATLSFAQTASVFHFRYESSISAVFLLAKSPAFPLEEHNPARVA
jgi:hypothetical protein